MTVAPSVYRRLRPRFARQPGIRLALGAHPLHVSAFPAIEWRLFDEYVSDTSYIGEVGLDFSSRGVVSRPAQERAFRRVLERVRTLKKVVSIHSRRAEDAVLELLSEL